MAAGLAAAEVVRIPVACSLLACVALLAKLRSRQRIAVAGVAVAVADQTRSGSAVVRPVPSLHSC